MCSKPPAGDPFWGDGVSLSTFHQGLAEDQYRPELFTATRGDLFAGRNVTAITLQVPDVTFGGTDVAVWALLSPYGHGPQRQVSRRAIRCCGRCSSRSPTDTEALNAGSPALSAVTKLGEAVRRTAAHVAKA